MTGLWQVSGRSSLPLEGWLRYDPEYVARCSSTFDLYLLWRTVAVVLKGIGAS
jgi:lipopolysaccharide/colanic/teichoic acid biosynthesis glycosyltransferase